MCCPRPSAIATRFWRQFRLADGGAGCPPSPSPWKPSPPPASLGIATAIAFSQSRLLERTLYPYAVILQVTPVVAIAPLILIWVGFEHINLALVIIATIVAFFPILAGATLGLKSADFNLIDLTRLYGASRVQTLVAHPPAHRPALSAVGHEDGRRAGADRRGGGGIRRRLAAPPPAWPGASWNPATGWRSPRCSPPWRLLALTGVADLRRLVAAGMAAAAALARKRAQRVLSLAS